MPPDDKRKLLVSLREDCGAHREMALKQIAHASLNLWRERYDIAARHLEQAMNHTKDALRCYAALVKVRSEV